MENMGQQCIHRVFEVEQPQPQVCIAQRDQDVYQVIQKVRQDNLVGQNNIAAVVERIMAQNGLNMGLCRPNYTPLLIECVL